MPTAIGLRDSGGLKTVGWKWHKTLRLDLTRVGRDWLVLALATLPAVACPDFHARRRAGPASHSLHTPAASVLSTGRPATLALTPGRGLPALTMPVKVPPPPLVLCHTPAKPPDRDATTDSRLRNTTVRQNPAPAGNPSATSKGSCQGYTAPTGEVIMPTGVPGPCCRRLAGAEPRDRSADRRQRRPTIAAAGHSREHNDSGYSGAQQRSTDLPCGSGVTRGSQVQEPATLRVASTSWTRMKVNGLAPGQRSSPERCSQQPCSPGISADTAILPRLWIRPETNRAGTRRVRGGYAAGTRWVRCGYGQGCRQAPS